jgi:esterase/lipase superfamily enzyme
MKLSCTLTVLMWATIATTAANAQITTTIQGTVRDRSGAVMAGAAVTLTSETTGIERRATTGPTGEYLFENVPPGTYKIQVMASGFMEQTRTVSVQMGAAAAVFDFLFEGGLPPPPPPKKKPSTVDVMYATDRRAGGQARYGVTYTNDRSKDNLEYGIAKVSIPPDHRLGVLESPSIWTITFREDPKKYVVVVHTERREEAEFFNDIKTRASNGEIFVFIHGYNVTFEDALRRTAQLAFDLQFKGAIVSYTWPSGRKIPDYMMAEGTVDWSKPHLVAFLSALAGRSGALRIHVVAHSMGNRLLARALDNVFLANPSRASLFNHLVMAAADIDVDEFRQLEVNIRKSTQNLTMYVSQDDKALEQSQKLHRFNRVGQGGSSAVLIAGTETIDATGIDASFLGHSYIGDSKTVIGDLWQMIACDWPVDKRDGLRPSAPSDPRIWRLLANAPRRTDCQ